MEPVSKTRKTVLGTFLENVGPGDAPNQSPTPTPQQAAPQAEAPNLSTVLRYLLSTGEAGLEVTIPDIAVGLGATTVGIADVVQRMAYSGLVTVDGDPGREFIHLTDQGRGLASVA